LIHVEGWAHRERLSYSLAEGGSLLTLRHLATRYGVRVVPASPFRVRASSILILSSRELFSGSRLRLSRHATHERDAPATAPAPRRPRRAPLLHGAAVSRLPCWRPGLRSCVPRLGLPTPTLCALRLWMDGRSAWCACGEMCAAVRRVPGEYQAAGGAGSGSCDAGLPAQQLALGLLCIALLPCRCSEQRPVIHVDAV